MKIVMYHYVKNFGNTEFPKVKGLDVKNFDFQIKYLKSKFNVLDPKDIHEIVSEKKDLKDNYCWLTFDDGYIDHYEHVVPILEKNKLKASFFPPVRSALQETVLDVNKIQLILGKNNNQDLLLEEIKKNFFELNGDNKNSSFESFLKNIDTSSRYDNSKIILIKRLLQKELPKKIREKICDILFKKYVSKDVSSIAKRFYMSMAQIKEINEMGHEIGLHGYNHDWYGKLSKDDQYKEILQTVDFWKKNKILKEKFTMCYPYGDYTSDTVNILDKMKCSMALTVKVGAVPKNGYNHLELPRFDTNDFPKSP